MKTKIMSISESAKYSCEVFGIGTKEPPKLVTTGIPEFDQAVGGYGLGSCNVVAAATGVGKSSFELYCCLKQAERGFRPAIISLEDPPDVFGVRAISAITGIDSRRIRTKQLSGREEKAILSASKALETTDLRIGYAISQPIEAIKQVCKAIVSEGAGMVWVDYLQKSAKSENRRAEVDRYLSELHSITANANIPIVFLSQLRRPDNKKPNQRPSRYWLKESGGIENESRILIMLHPENGLLRCWIEKSTYGGEGTSIALVRDQSGTLSVGRFAVAQNATKPTLPPSFPPKLQNLGPALERVHPHLVPTLSLPTLPESL